MISSSAASSAHALPTTTSDFPAPAKPPQYPGLDLLRFAAAAAVAVGHIRAATFGAYGVLSTEDKSPLAAAFYFLTRMGGEAVIVFFVLSGYLIGGRYFTKIAQGKFNALDYGIDRAVRIGLPLIPALVLTAWVSVFQGGELQPLTFLVNAVSLQGVVMGCCYGGNAPLWSLPYEVWLYVLVLVVGLWLKQSTHRVSLFAALILLALIFSKLEFPYVLCWVLGAAAFVRPPRFAPYAMMLGLALFAFGLVGGQLGIDSASISSAARGRWTAWLPGLAVSKVLLGAGTALLVQQIALWNPASSVGRWVGRFGTKAAGFSFSLYLTHWPLLFFIGYFGLAGDSTMTFSAFAKFALVCAVALLVAWCSYWAFESRTQVVRAWVKRRLTGGMQPSLTVDRPA